MNLPQALPQGWWVIYEFDEWTKESLRDWHYPIQDDLEIFHLFESQTTQSALEEFRNDMDFMRELERDKKLDKLTKNFKLL